MRKRVVQGGALGIVALITIAAVLAFFLTRDGGAIPGQRLAAPPEVTVEQGELRGEWLPIPESDKQYASFKGIPYARPPLGPLRFKAPRPAESWSGVREATAAGSVCLQLDSVSANLVGSEDCLYLNVYSPRAPKHAGDPLPVYFFIHGGTFLFGSGTDILYGPEFLMLQDIIVVTINYRLNVFGYLNLDNEEVPGNAGLKDQVAALQWVHRNIHRFGGDPMRITVGGQSAGAASAHLLAILPQTRDLVKRAILQSFSALHSISYNEDHIEIALRLGQRLANGAHVTRDNVTSLVMQLPADVIVGAAAPMVQELLTSVATQIPFAVTPERRPAVPWGEERLITGDTEMLVLKTIDYPKEVLMGITNREMLQSYYIHGYPFNISLIDYRIDHLDTLCTRNVIPYRDTLSYLDLDGVVGPSDWPDVFQEIHKHYFDQYDPTCNKTCSFQRYLDDVAFNVDTNRLSELRRDQSGSTTYVYRFGVRTGYNYSPLFDPSDPAQQSAAAHSDDLAYLWRLRPLEQTLRGGDLGPKTLRRMTNIWGSFVRTGKPSAGVGEEAEGAAGWAPNEQSLNFLNIGPELHVRSGNVGGSNIPFWLGLYQKYRLKRST